MRGTRLVYETLKQQIENNQYAPGSRLPPELNLAGNFGVSRMTVRRALAMLEEEKRIFCRPGVGSFVKQFQEEEEEEPVPVRIGITSLDPANLDYMPLYYNEIYASLARACSECNCDLVFLTREEYFAGEKADAFFSLTLNMDELDAASQLASRFPVILLNRITDRPELSYVAVDYIESTARVVYRMLMNGASNILFLGGSSRNTLYPHFTRERGYRIGHDRAGSVVQDALILPMDLQYQDVADRLLRYEPDVIFVSGNRFMPQAQTAIAMTRSKLRKPVSLFSFDNSLPFESIEAEFSCGNMPIGAMCRTAVKFLAERVRGHQSPPVLHQIFPMGYHIANCPYLI